MLFTSCVVEIIIITNYNYYYYYYSPSSDVDMNTVYMSVTFNLANLTYERTIHVDKFLAPCAKLAWDNLGTVHGT